MEDGAVLLMALSIPESERSALGPTAADSSWRPQPLREQWWFWRCWVQRTERKVDLGMGLRCLERIVIIWHSSFPVITLKIPHMWVYGRGTGTYQEGGLRVGKRWDSVRSRHHFLIEVLNALPISTLVPPGLLCFDSWQTLVPQASDWEQLKLSLSVTGTVNTHQDRGEEKTCNNGQQQEKSNLKQRILISNLVKCYNSSTRIWWQIKRIFVHYCHHLSIRFLW